MKKWTSDILTLQKFDMRLRDLEIKYRTIPQEKARMKEELEAASTVTRNAKEQLQKVYGHILEVRMDNTRTRKKLEFDDDEIRLGDPAQVFADFYREMQGRDLTGEERGIVDQAYDHAKGDEQ